MMSTNNNASNSQPVNGSDLTTAVRPKRLVKIGVSRTRDGKHVKQQQRLHNDPLSTIIIQLVADSELDDQKNI